MEFNDVIKNFSSTRKLNGTILVAERGDSKHWGHFGFVDVETKVGITDKTQFLIASVTKQFTAAAVLKALHERFPSEEEILQSLHQPVAFFLSMNHGIWDGDMPGWANEVTIHHLLTHSSGIPSYTGLPGFKACEANPPEVSEMVSLFKKEPLEFKLGSEFSYNNSGYLLLGEIVLEIAGLPLGDYMEKTFFAPLGMTSTTYATQGTVPDLKNSDPRFKDLALGYTFDALDPQATLYEIEQYTPMEVPRGGGSLVSTASDLLKWNNALHNGLVLPDFLYKLLIAQHMKNIPEPWARLGESYAYGIAIRNHLKLGQVYVHHGGINGFRSALVYIPSQNLSIIILTNVEESVQQTEKEVYYNILAFEQFALDHFLTPRT